MKVVIAGMAKTGTTALFNIVLPAMPVRTRQLFEPAQYVAVGERNALAKVLTDRSGSTDIESFAGFDRKVQIVRDPRDTLVSRLLYMSYDRPDVWDDPERARALVELMRRKEQDPHSVTVQEGFAFFLPGSQVDFEEKAIRFDAGIRFVREHPEYFRIAYDDIVTGRLQPLSEHLGLPLSLQQMRDSAELRRVSRSRGSGSWKSWFTEADVAHFRPRLKEAMEALGYEDDWSLDPNPTIDPSICSQYVEKLLAQAVVNNAPPTRWQRLRSRIRSRLSRVKRRILAPRT